MPQLITLRSFDVTGHNAAYICPDLPRKALRQVRRVLLQGIYAARNRDKIKEALSMRKLYILEYKKEDGLSSLTIADPDIKLDNGNIKVLGILIGDYADEIINALIREE